MRLGQTSLIVFLSKILGSAIGFLATIYFARELGEEIYGFFALTLAVVAWLGIIKGFGFGSATVKRISEGDDPEAYLFASAFVKLALTGFIAVFVFVFRHQIDAYVGANVWQFVILLVFVTIFSSFINAALKGYHLVHIYAPLSTAKQAVRSLVMVGLVYLGWELTGMLLGYAVGTVFVAVVGFYWIRPNLVIPRWRHITSLFDFAKFSWLGSMRSRTFNDVDIVILGVFVSGGFVGVYAIAWSLSMFLIIFATAITTTLFPEISKVSTEGNKEYVGTLTEDSLTYSGLLLIPGLVGGYLLGERLLRIYGPGFVIGETILWILILAVLVYTYAVQLLNVLNGIDRPDLAFRANAVLIVANITLNFVLIWWIGWVGAAIATAASAVVGLVMAYRYASHVVDFTIPYAEIGRQWVAAIIMGLVVYGGLYLENTYSMLSHNFATVMILVGIGAVVYFLSYYTISKEFRTTIGENLPFNIPLLPV